MDTQDIMRERVVNSRAGKLAVALLIAALAPAAFAASDAGVKRKHPFYPPAPAMGEQTLAEAKAKSEGCLSCHTYPTEDRHGSDFADAWTMHETKVNLGCIDCHGGNPRVDKPTGSERHEHAYEVAMEQAHVLPDYPEFWEYPSSANPEHSYTLLNRESPEFVRFVNPSDYRVVEEACGACHMEVIVAAKRSIMATGAMLFGGASYNNGILPFKNYILGEAYTREGLPSAIVGPTLPDSARRQVVNGLLPQLLPLPAWETVRPADVFRIFERGGRNILNLFPETGIPNSLGLIQRLEEPGRPDFRQSNRGPGTGLRIAVPVINIHKTRLNDPLMWFLGTNDNPGDYRTSGCGACHVVYANDREWRHSGQYAKYGNRGETQTADAAIPKSEEGHPLKHRFTRSIPTAQCMSCHMHQPNMFMNTYLGYTMWDYESDAPSMFPKDQRYPTDAEIRMINERNPEEAAIRGLWSDPEFLEQVSEMNPELNNTQFADYHGHGWNFRAVFKKDRKGNLLDAENNVVPPDDPEKFDKAVHMYSIHAEVGMHCADCHFAQDSHGNGHIYGEVANAVEIDCIDCHGTADAYPTLRTSGPAAMPGGRDLSVLINPDGRRRFEWKGDRLFQRGLLKRKRADGKEVYPEWEISLVKDAVNPDLPECDEFVSKGKCFNPKAARAKLMSTDTDTQHWGKDVEPEDRAHSYDKMECYACHIAWTTSCGGCHLPIQANWLTERHHYEGGITRNYATYNPQVVRDQIFMLGRRGKINGGRIAPLRSTSALVLSSTNSNRERIYIQQPPIAASGYSSQAINPHFPHTVRKTETKTCTDCHLARDGNNNAIMAQTLGYGTDFIDFIGFHAWVGTRKGVTAVQVTEWDEPQAVIGSFLHQYAYPDYYANHIANDRELKTAHHQKGHAVNCLQLRGEYLYAAVGSEGMRAYDVAAIGNKGISDKILTAPVGPLGNDLRVDTKDATCVAMATTQPVHPDRNEGVLMREINQERPFHPIYKYVFITDAKEGLILTDNQTLSDGEPRNNFLKRALTWNPGGILNGARHIVMGGYYLYIAADAGLVIVDANNPLRPEHIATVPLNGARSSHLQFRYLFVTDADGLKAIDVTDPHNPRLTPDNTIRLANANGVWVSRMYAYVAAGADGLVIVDVEHPEAMKTYMQFNDGLVDSRDVTVATTNASLFAYVADGDGGLKVVQLTSPESQPRFYGFSPEPKPQIVAHYQTDWPALSVSDALERDRAVDETGGQVAVFGRLGAGPLTYDDQRKLYLDEDGRPWFVTDAVSEHVSGNTDSPDGRAAAGGRSPNSARHGGSKGRTLNAGAPAGGD